MKRITKEQAAFDKLLPYQKAPRKSLIREDRGIQGFNDLLQDTELCADIEIFFAGRNLKPNTVRIDYVSEHKDELLFLLHELKIIRVNWSKWQEIQERKNNPLDIKDIPFVYATNVVRDLLDLMRRVDEEREEMKTKFEEEQYFKKRLWEKPRGNKTPTNQTVYVCGKLTLDLHRAVVTVKGRKPYPISPTDRITKTLRLLMENKGTVVTNTQIAKLLDIPSYRDDSKDSDPTLKRDVQSVRRDLRKMLIKAGVTNKQIASLIQSKTNIGYLMTTD